MTAGSPFAVRGVVEGFYGRPWSHAQRLDLIPFLAAHGMNTFVYAPKDDPLLRRAWREPYGGRELERLRELVESCRAHEVGLVYCLSPGMSISYSSESDVRALGDKFGAVGELGVRQFGLLLDDIPQQLQYEADRSRFADLVDAQASLIGRVFQGLPSGTGLIVCPTTYWGYGDEPYIARLGRAIDPRIGMFWTGRAICSPTIDLSDAATVARSSMRLPTYWDNYPVNDVAMTDELHVGPYRGRDRHLYRFATGVIANGMELFESSKIAFATIADYLRAPEAYDPEASWQLALREVVGDADRDAYALFADNVRSSCLSAEDAPAVTRALETFLFRLNQGEGVAAAADLGALADRLLAAADHLLRGPVANPALIAEGRPWIEAFETGAQAMRCMADLAVRGRLGADAAAELRPYLDRLRDARVRVYGDTLTMTLTDLIDPRTVTEEAEVRAGGGRS
ncbi:MAG TPA: protein O-GlcNAcase [Candidatus Limnocylindrales bacterium]